MDWEKAYGFLQKYYYEYGTINLPESYISEEGLLIGKWLATQRNLYRKESLSNEKIDALNKIGMIWCPLKTKDDIGYEHALTYYKKYGDLIVPEKYKSEDGYKLGRWIERKRRKKKDGRLSKELQDKLEEIGMIWNVNRMKWEKAYKDAKEFYEKNGHLHIDKNYKTEDGLLLRQWVARQKCIYWGTVGGYLTDEQIKKLNDIKIDWGYCRDNSENRV